MPSATQITQWLDDFIPRRFSLDPKCTFYQWNEHVPLLEYPRIFPSFFVFRHGFFVLAQKNTERFESSGRGLGSSSGAILETIIDEVLENECVLTLCTLRAQSKAPSQKRRAVCGGFCEKKTDILVSQCYWFMMFHFQSIHILWDKHTIVLLYIYI